MTRRIILMWENTRIFSKTGRIRFTHYVLGNIGEITGKLRGREGGINWPVITIYFTGIPIINRINDNIESFKFLFIYTLRNFKFSSDKICWSTGIKYTLGESFVKFC